MTFLAHNTPTISPPTHISRIPRVTRSRFPPLISWNPLEYYNLFSLASRADSKELSNYEHFNCSKYCNMLAHTELGMKFREISLDAKRTIDNATATVEGGVQNSLKRMKLTEKVESVRAKMSSLVDDEVKAKYTEKYRKVKQEFHGFYEDVVKTQSKSITSIIHSKVRRFQDRVKEFYMDRVMDTTQSYYCIGHQMRNFVLSSVLLQHVAFTVLLWRHWDKVQLSTGETLAQASFSTTLGILGIVLLYWIFALTSMFTRSLPQWLLYMTMSLTLVHFSPFEIVTFDFTLLLLTIALATISIFDIYHKLYKKQLVYERSVLQYHMLMALQVSCFFIHLVEPSVIMVATFVTLIFSWKDLLFIFNIEAQSNILKTGWKLLKQSFHRWVGIVVANTLWVAIVNITSQIVPYSLLHGKMDNSNASLIILIAQISILHSCIFLKYKVRYPDEKQIIDHQHGIIVEEHNVMMIEHRMDQQNPNLLDDPLAPRAAIADGQDQDHENDNDDLNLQQQIPPPPPIPTQWIVQNQQRQHAALLAAAQQRRAQANLNNIHVHNNPIGQNGQPQQQPQQTNGDNNGTGFSTSLTLLHPTLYWHYVWMLGVICDFIMGLLARIGYDGLAQSLSLVLPVIVLVAVLPIQIHYWNNKYNYDLRPCEFEHPHLHGMQNPQR